MRWRIACIMLMLASGACQSTASELNPPSSSSHAPSAAAHVLLVKFSADAASALSGGLTNGPAIVTGIESLDALFARYGVSMIEPVFEHVQDPEAIKEKYPARAKRATPGTEIPDLSGVYKLTLDPASNLNEAIAAFSADSHVEYAQPDYLATVQPSP